MVSYNKSELLNKLEKLEIINNNNKVITKYNGRVLKVTNVSDRYEVFDIVKYIKDKIDIIEKNFKISKYELIISGGVQLLKLTSDVINLSGIEFKKSFFILNSSDKTKRLSLNIGLVCDMFGFYIVDGNSAYVENKHLRGVTEMAEGASNSFNEESFEDQINSINSIINHQVKYSDIKKIILGDKEEIPKINFKKLEAFNRSLYYNNKNLNLDSIKRSYLLNSHKSKSLDVPEDKDFEIDAFLAFREYMKIFKNKDPQIVKKETSRILNITKYAKRMRALDLLGI